jgi:hypothetical protein
MQFLPRRRPLELSAQRVRALRPSLNTPVIAMPELPAGPACAAILVHVEPGHGLQINVGVRSLGSGAVALYGFDGPISAALVGIALDAALSFAESMGFLFDEDMIGDDASSREKAFLRWGELIGDGAPAAAFETAGGEADLFEPDSGEPTDPTGESEDSAEAQPETGLGGSGAAPAANARFQTPAPGGAAVLTKFRGSGAVAGRAPAGTGELEDARAQKRQPLGRMRLVKRRAGEARQDARRVWLLRVLTSF